MVNLKPKIRPMNQKCLVCKFDQLRTAQRRADPDEKILTVSWASQPNSNGDNVIRKNISNGMCQSDQYITLKMFNFW